MMYICRDPAERLDFLEPFFYIASLACAYGQDLLKSQARCNNPAEMLDFLEPFFYMASLACAYGYDLSKSQAGLDHPIEMLADLSVQELSGKYCLRNLRFEALVASRAPRPGYRPQN